MSDTGPSAGADPSALSDPGASEDRLVGLEVGDGFSFESDGTPIGELDVDAPDSLLDRGATVAEQAALERSWRFGHVIVDEAQDLTPMQWRMIARRSHGGAITMVGDLAQRSIGGPGEWADHLPAALQGFAEQELTINYRSPAEVDRLAEAVLADLAPGLSPSRSIRSVGPDGRPVVTRLGGGDRQFDADLVPWVVARREALTAGRMAVIGVDLPSTRPDVPDLLWLDPWQAKGLEFDAVVVVEPAAIAELDHGLSLLYVAITRTTTYLDLVHERPLPPVLGEVLSEALAD